MGTIPSSDLFAGKQLPKPREGGSLYTCRVCHLSFRFPCPSDDELNSLYAIGCGDAWTSGHPRKDWKVAKAWIEERLPLGSSILDVGCFDGGFLNTLMPGYQRYGVEIQSSAREKACDTGVNLIAAGYDELANWSDRFDAVVAFDLIEHVRDPAKLLAMFASVVRSSGLVIVSSGNSDAWSWGLLGARYWYCAIGEHISFVNPRWARPACHRVGLTLQCYKFFSHSGAGPNRKLTEALKNLAYWLTPGTMAVIRRMGAGGKDARRFPELADYPPSWMSALDHFIFLCAKPAT
jgi:SAM-dependent methyltransferase